ncbi:hypothetical protein BH23GEM4_BH23GEM4_18780 [soil metagenome]
MPKTSLNLSLDVEAVERAKRYSEVHGTSVSQLVGAFLLHLPLESDTGTADLTPTVRRLLGVAKDGSGREEYRRYLLEKYGQ